MAFHSPLLWFIDLLKAGGEESVDCLSWDVEPFRSGVGPDGFGEVGVDIKGNNVDPIGRNGTFPLARPGLAVYFGAKLRCGGGDGLSEDLEVSTFLFVIERSIRVDV